MPLPDVPSERCRLPLPLPERRRRWAEGAAALAVLLGACAGPGEAPGGAVAEIPPLAEAVPAGASGMVVTANPLATRAGVEILERGGSAVDAAVAIEAVLSLVEPQSSGLGGGGFLVHLDAGSGRISTWDGRETAPAGADPRMFLNVEGEPLGFLEAKHSGRSVGVPGVVPMLALAHGTHGRLPWAELFDRARQLAVEGFPVSPRLHGMIERFGPYLPDEPGEGPTDARDYLYGEDGEPPAVGERLYNPAYARTLERLAADPRALHRGPIAREIVAAAQAPPRAGTLTLEDLAAYEALEREPLCVPYRTLSLCGPPPPSSWIAVGTAMALLDRIPRFAGAPEAPRDWTLVVEAQRLAYADRDRWIADPAHVPVPVEGLLDPAYLDRRAARIDPERAGAAAPGDPWAFQESPGTVPGADGTEDRPGTTHFVVVDGAGNVVSMTASVESIFGSARMAGGMFLNNQLTDFSFRPVDEAGGAVANAVASGKRPRSSMSPTIAVDADGDLRMATGSPGGNSIIAYTIKSLVGVLDWGLPPAEAVALPNVVARGEPVRVERDRASTALVEALEAYGLEVDASAGENSGLSVVVRHPDGRLEGGADPRREGTVEVPSRAGMVVP